MTLEKFYSELALDSLKLVGTGQTALECKLHAEAGNEIAKVLSASVHAHIYSVECMIGEARYSGKAIFKAVYCTVTGQTVCVEYVAEFDDKISDKRITPSVRAYSKCSVVDTNTISVSPDEIKLAAVIEVELEGILSEQVKFIEKTSPDLITKSELLEICTLNSGTNNTFTINSDIEIKHNIYSVISVSGEAFVENTEIFDGGIRVIGKIYLKVCYLETVDSVAMQSTETVLQYNQEIEAPNITSECFVGAFVKLVESKITAALVSAESESSVSVECIVNLNAFAYETKKISVISDAFSVTNKLNMDIESFTNLKFEASKYCEEKIEGEITLDDTLPLVDKVLLVTGTSTQIANSYCNDGGFIVEGIAYANVIYFNEQNNSQYAVQIELPFSIKVNMPQITDKYIIKLSAGISDINAKTKRGNLITVEAELKINAYFFTENSKAVLKDISEGDLLPLSEYAIGIYIVRKGQTVWDIAKYAGINPNLIYTQNPDIIEPLQEGQRLKVYRQLS
ncbi:MAG: SPOCS domain-containing protein [Clostridia bacterium]|jgi:hypothetical protein|nr:DUF3794 domain-containing protein [Clostridia bacterium]MDD4275490.1 DUF3794 domain-containing protein [Clostridia bacterium]